MGDQDQSAHWNLRVELAMSPCCNNAAGSGEGLDPADKAAGGSQLRLPTQDTTGKEMAKNKKLQCTTPMQKKCTDMEQQAKIGARLKKNGQKVQNVDGSQMTVQFGG